MRTGLYFLAGTAFWLTAGTAVAGDEDAKDEDAGLTYSGITLSSVMTDFDNLDDPINLGAVLGIRIPLVNFATAEIDFSTTIVPGENQGASSGGLGGGGGGDECVLPNPFPVGGECPILKAAGTAKAATTSSEDLRLTSVAVYAVFRSPPELLANFYGLGKIGYRYLDANIPEIAEDDQTGVAYGLGVGYHYDWNESNGGIEVLYTKMSDTLDFVTLNITYGFDW